MIQTIKNKLIIGLIISIIAVLGVWLNPYTIAKKSTLEQYEIDKFNDSTSIAKMDVELKDKDVQIFGIQQDLDICKANDSKLKIVIAGQTAEIKRLANAENTCCEELKHAEETGGIIRYNWLGKVKKKK